MAQTEEKIRHALKGCKDPELGINIVDLGLIYKIEATDTAVNIQMTLTTPGCPLQPYFQQDIEERVTAATGIKHVSIDLTFDPPWTPAAMTEEGRRLLTVMR